MPRAEGSPPIGASILVVDDDPQVLRALEKFLKGEGYAPLLACCAKDAIALALREVTDLVLLDVRLPDANGIAILKEKLLPGLGDHKVILLTGYGDRKEAKEAVLAGAYDYLTKPVDFSRLGIVIRNCLRLQGLAKEVAELSGGAARFTSLPEIVGASPQMLALIEQIKRVAAFDVPVLILGESGTGKELVARSIHALSPRCKGPFVSVDCGALPDTLVEAEVFGYERGAFSGAVQAKPGKLERADGGTFFLDEIGNIPALIQPKLLRVLQSQKVERLGGSRAVQVDARVLSATNANVERMVAEGSFRRDLYHRLNTLVLTVPPLRERMGDISLLAHYALMMANRAYHTQVRGISAEAMAMLERYPWPGNVRELENCIRSAVIMADRVVEPDHLPLQIREGGERREIRPRVDVRSGESLAQIRRRAAEEAERAVILRILGETGWNKAEAARRLGVDYKTLYTKLRQYQIQTPKKHPDSEQPE